MRDKIRKMVELGNHPSTPAAEALQAQNQARRFLTRYNLKHNDLSTASSSGLKKVRAAAAPEQGISTYVCMYVCMYVYMYVYNKYSTYTSHIRYVYTLKHLLEAGETTINIVICISRVAIYPFLYISHTTIYLYICYIPFVHVYQIQLSTYIYMYICMYA